VKVKVVLFGISTVIESLLCELRFYGFVTFVLE